MFTDFSSTRTEGIVVSVQTAYIEDQSSPDLEHFVFAYKIRITNESDHTVQLMARHWDIVDALGRKRLVEGEGVIGVQPVLGPGECHEYISGCDFQTPVGQMSGFYTMFRPLDGSYFQVIIPRFTMACPLVLN